MSKHNPLHVVNETRNWAKIVLACGVGLASVILAARGDLTAEVIASLANLLR